MIRRPPISTLFPSPTLSRSVQILPVEVGPVDGREPQLGVGRPPQHEVRYPHLPARSDEQVHVRHVREVQARGRSEEHTSELQSQSNLVCRLLLEKKKKKTKT